MEEEKTLNDKVKARFLGTGWELKSMIKQMEMENKAVATNLTKCVEFMLQSVHCVTSSDKIVPSTIDSAHFSEILNIVWAQFVVDGIFLQENLVAGKLDEDVQHSKESVDVDRLKKAAITRLLFAFKFIRLHGDEEYSPLPKSMIWKISRCLQNAGVPFKVRQKIKEKSIYQGLVNGSAEARQIYKIITDQIKIDAFFLKQVS